MSPLSITQLAMENGSERATGKNYLQSLLVQALKKKLGEFTTKTTDNSALNFIHPLAESIMILALIYDGVVELGLKVSTFGKALLNYHGISCIALGDLMKVLERNLQLENCTILVSMDDREMVLCLPDFDTIMSQPISQYHIAFAWRLGTVSSDLQQVFEGEILLRSSMILVGMDVCLSVQDFRHVALILTRNTFMNSSIYDMPLPQMNPFPASCMTVGGMSNVLSFAISGNVSKQLYALQSSQSAMSPDSKPAYELTFSSARNSSSVNNGTQFSPWLAALSGIPNNASLSAPSSPVPLQRGNGSHFCPILNRGPPALKSLNSSPLTPKTGCSTQVQASASPQQAFPFFQSSCNDQIFSVLCSSPSSSDQLKPREFESFYPVVLLLAGVSAMSHLIIIIFVIMVTALMLWEMKDACKVLRTGRRLDYLATNLEVMDMDWVLYYAAGLNGPSITSN